MRGRGGRGFSSALSRAEVAAAEADLAEAEEACCCLPTKAQSTGAPRTAHRHCHSALLRFSDRELASAFYDRARRGERAIAPVASALFAHDPFLAFFASLSARAVLVHIGLALKHKC